MADTPYNAQVDKLPIGSRTGSETGDMIADESDRAEEALEGMGERGEKYKQQARRQRLIAQRMRQLTEKDDLKARNIREPRNAKFQDQKNKENSKLSAIDIGVMSGVAILFDIAGGLLSLLPVVGNAITAVTVFPLATLTLYLMYKKHDIELRSTKALVKFWGTLCIGFIPIISIFPEYLLNVVLASVAKKAEEKLNL